MTNVTVLKETDTKFEKIVELTNALKYGLPERFNPQLLISALAGMIIDTLYESTTPEQFLDSIQYVSKGLLKAAVKEMQMRTN